MINAFKKWNARKYPVDKLEAVQRKAARFVKNCWDKERGTVTHLLKELNWGTLQARRQKARLIMFYKAIHNLVDLPLPNHLIPLPAKTTRQYHTKRYYVLNANTNSYKRTFFPGTVQMWNKEEVQTL